MVMADLGTKIDWLSDLKTKTEELNFSVKGLHSKVTCLEEERDEENC